MQYRRIIYSTVSSEPATEPISLSEAKKHLRVDGDEENGLITILIQSAREMVEKFTNRSLITQTRIARLDSFPCDRFILIPAGPLQSITSIVYSNEIDQNITMSTSDYRVDIYSNVPRVEVVNYWPSTYDKINAVVITYVSGYGAASSVPAALKSAMLLILGHLYENREQVVDGSMTEIPFGAESLMSPFVLEHDVTYNAYRTA